jgi:hypothetical protein
MPGMLPQINVVPPAPRRTKRHNPYMIEIEPIAMTPNSTRIPMARGNIISQEAVTFVTAAVYGEPGTTWLPQEFVFASTVNDVANNNTTCEIDHFCAPVIHPVTGESITQYKKLQRDPLLQELWGTAWGKEFGSMAQGDKHTNTPGTDSIFIMSHDEIGRIPEDRTVTYARVVVDFRPQKRTLIE